ncbi:hypothetical protein [Micromonospora chalcea]|uniref:hypothetical protein n=1 Tax=Micromonospora chalcea TaxID=1874 RepID=UPI0033325FA1
MFLGEPDGVVEELPGRGEPAVVSRGERERDRVADAPARRAGDVDDAPAKRKRALVQGSGEQAQGVAELVGSHRSSWVVDGAAAGRGDRPGGRAVRRAVGSESGAGQAGGMATTSTSTPSVRSVFTAW